MNYINGTSELIMLTKLIAFSGFSALVGCLSNKHHNNVKDDPEAIFSSIILSLSRSYYKRFLITQLNRKLAKVVR